MGFGHGLPPDRIEWTLLTIGHLSMNKFWGETERVRAPLCTTTLIHTSSGLVLVDPAVEPASMPQLLHDGAGLRSKDVRYVFVTHSHGDHWVGLEAFPHATWLMGEPEIAYWRSRAGDRERGLLERIRPADDEPLPGLRAVHLPGHTPGITSLLFGWRGRTVAVVGDTVMTEAHFRAREGHINSTDEEQARAAIDRLAREADVIVPGHDNAFAVAWTGVGLT